jgi:hypothetical protein
MTSLIKIMTYYDNREMQSGEKRGRILSGKADDKSEQRFFLIAPAGWGLLL